MSDTEKYTLEIILEHLTVCEKRFSEIKEPQDFVNTDYGNTLLDAIVARLQAVGENLKRLLKHNNALQQKYPAIEWDKIIKFRDFISHHYEKLDYEVIFDICKVDLPPLIDKITEELNK
jgi:uncharacterized protein with HEPN domain